VSLINLLHDSLLYVTDSLSKTKMQILDHEDNEMMRPMKVVR
jgi:hypothetical protein